MRPLSSLLYILVIFIILLQNENLNLINGLPFDLIVPNISTGWFHKPGPTESLIFGLIILKVIALRMAGVFPYNLNELMEEGSYFNYGLKQLRKRIGKRSLIEYPTDKEIEIINRILIGLRRIDSHDCLLFNICINKNKLNGSFPLLGMEIFNKFMKNGKSDVWDIFQDAYTTTPNTKCEDKYSLCPLKENELSISEVLNGLF